VDADEELITGFKRPERLPICDCLPFASKYGEHITDLRVPSQYWRRMAVCLHDIEKPLAFSRTSSESFLDSPTHYATVHIIVVVPGMSWLSACHHHRHCEKRAETSHRSTDELLTCSAMADTVSGYVLQAPAIFAWFFIQVPLDVVIDIGCLFADGGGVRGLAQLLILQRIFITMHTIVVDELHADHGPLDPCDFFDLIGGTSTGGQVRTSSHRGMLS